MRSLLLAVVTCSSLSGASALAQDAGAGIDPSTYDVRLVDLEHDVRALGADVAASERRLALLAERALGEPLTAATADIRFDDRMGPFYRLVGASFRLDGTSVGQHWDDDGLPRTIPILRGAVTPGAHLLSVELTYVGEQDSPFPYIRGYRMRLSSSHSFEADEAYRLRVLGAPGGGATTGFMERPRVRFEDGR